MKNISSKSSKCWTKSFFLCEKKLFCWLEKIFEREKNLQLEKKKKEFSKNMIFLKKEMWVEMNVDWTNISSDLSIWKTWELWIWLCERLVKERKWALIVGRGPFRLRWLDDQRIGEFR